VTPTPPVTDVTFRLTILNTPIAGAPIQVNTETKITDSEGQFTASLENSTLYTISTGLAAISFDPILETGAALSARSPVTIEAQRLITSTEDPCRILIDGTEHVYFSSTNLTDEPLTVPLSSTSLNQILSVTGEAVPPEIFAPGTSGFSIPTSTFTSGTELLGVWKFLGQEITVSSNLNICSDRGVPGQCEVIDPTVLRGPFDYVRKVIIRLTKQSLSAAKSGRWRSTNGKYRVPFLTRGANALGAMEGLFTQSKSQNFVCEVMPMSCTLKRVPKQALVSAFAGIFKGKVPRGLEHISARSKKEIAAFQRELRKLPDTYVTCE